LTDSKSNHLFNIIQNFDREDILELLGNVEKKLELEQNLIYIPQGKTMVIGDLHGDIISLKKILQIFFRDVFQTILFLGDYVDRGPKQLEVINTLFHYKRLMPERVVLLRGNHEDRFINRNYGFYDELRLKFPSYKELFRRYNQVFSILPIAAITWNKIFCVHGGIPEGLEDIEEINFLPKKHEDKDCKISTQLIWNDPREKGKDFRQSTRGPGIKTFGKKAFNDFMANNDLTLMIRGHERFKNGFKTYFNEQLISIFSSQSYSKRATATVAFINYEGDVELIPL